MVLSVGSFSTSQTFSLTNSQSAFSRRSVFSNNRSSSTVSTNALNNTLTQLLSNQGFLNNRRTLRLAQQFAANSSSNSTSSASSSTTTSSNTASNTSSVSNPPTRRESLHATYRDQGTRYRNLRNTLLNSTGGTSTLSSGTGYIGSGDDTFTVSGSSVSALGGAGNDTINATNATGGILATHQGDDTITVSGTTGAIISTGSGSDSVVLASGSTGNTIHTGDGDNTITIDKSSVNNTFQGGSGTNTLSISDGSFSDFTVTDNGDGTQTYTVTGTTNSFTLSSSSNIANIAFSDQTVAFSSGSPAPTMTVSGNSGTETGTSGVDVIAVEGNSNHVYGLAGTDTINVTGNSNLVYGGDDNDTINLNDGTNNRAYGDNGDDTINYTFAAGTSSLTYAYGGAGNDTLNITNKNLADLSLMYTPGIEGTNAPTIWLSDSSTGEHVLVKGDIETITFADNASYTFAELRDQTSVNANSSSANGAHTYNLTNNNDNFGASFTGGATVNGLGGDDTITIKANDLTVNGGDGNDTITVQSNTTNGTITGGAGTDSVSVSGNFGDFTVTDNGNNTLTLNDGSTSFTIDNTVESVTFGDGSQTYANILASAPISLTSGLSTTNLTTGNNSSALSASNTLLNGLAGDDTISATNSAYTNAVIDAGDGNDNLIGVTNLNDVTFVGGAGTDSLNLSGEASSVFTVSTVETSEYGTVYKLTHNTNSTEILIDESIESVQFAHGSTTYTMSDFATAASGSGTLA